MAKSLEFISIDQFHDEAKRILSDKIWKFLVATSERGITYETCNDDYTRIKLRPRALKDVRRRDLSTSLLGEKVSFPIGVSPSAFHALFSEGGEINTAKACSAMGTCMILSLAADQLIGEVGKEFAHGFGWMQMYIFKNRQGTLRIMRDAERSGFRALVVTVDHCVTPFGRAKMGRQTINILNAGYATVTDGLDDSLTWDDFAWLVNNTRLPVVAKGIMTAEDAVLAVKHGASGVLVSNHGGRLLDGVPSTISVLPEVVAAVGDKVEVYLDGGVRYGSDVLKALALGARAVFIGRPAIWGLVCGETHGVERVLTILKNQLETAMALTGFRQIGDVNNTCLWKDAKL